MRQLAFTFCVLFFGLASGYLFKILYEKKIIHLPFSIHRLRIQLQQVGMIVFLSGSFFLALWVVKLPDMRLSAMPLICLLAIFCGGMLALLFARLLKLSRPKTGALYCCGSFTNIGAIGALICYVFIGEAGFALVPVYKLFEEIFYFTVGFPTAKSYGSDSSTHIHFSQRLRQVLADPFVISILTAIILGTSLNLSGIERPGWCSTLTAFMVPAGSICLLTSIGMAMRFSKISSYLREAGCVIGIKSFLVPAVAVMTGYVLGLHQVADGLPLKVVLICSSMPVAFIALVPPSLYELDLDLANSCWAASTGSLVITLPILWGLLQLL